MVLVVDVDVERFLECVLVFDGSFLEVVLLLVVDVINTERLFGVVDFEECLSDVSEVLIELSLFVDHLVLVDVRLDDFFLPCQW